MPLILSGNVASATAAGYEVANSCRFDTAGTTYMTKAAFSNTGTNAFKFTFSCWIKRANLGVNQRILTAGDSTRDGFTFNTSDQLQFFAGSNSSEVNPFVTNRRFRDPSAWMHLVIACDSELTGATNQTKLYVNGTLETSFSATAAVDDENTWHIGNAKIHRIGTDSDSSLDYYLDGYLAEVVLIDGQQLTASSFGEFDTEDSPTIWKPKDVSGLTFGTNGFYLDFEDSSALGNDVSGNGNDLTATNLAATDQATDTPTNNFATMNPLDNYYAAATFSEGNCKVVKGTQGRNAGVTSTMGVANGKWYVEMKYGGSEGGGSTVNDASVGITARTATDNNHEPGHYSDDYTYKGQSGNYRNNDGYTSYGNTWTTNDIIGVALNLDDDELKFYKNNTVQNSGTAISISATPHTGNYFFVVGNHANELEPVFQMNFGGCSSFALTSAAQDENGYGNFEYAPPSGFLALCTKNLGSDGG